MLFRSDCKHKASGYGYYYYYGDDKKQGAPAPAFIADPTKQVMKPKSAHTTKPRRMAKPQAQPTQVATPQAQPQRASVNPLVNSQNGQKLQDHSRFSR